MTSLSVQTERELLAELFRLAAEREQAEQRRQRDYDQRGRQAVQDFRDAQQGITKRYHTEKERTEQEYRSLRSGTIVETDNRVTEARVGHDNLQRRLADQCDDAQQKAKKEYEGEAWEINAVFESTKLGPKQRYKQTKQQVRAVVAQLDALVEQARTHLSICNFAKVRDRQPPEPAAASEVAATDAAAQLTAALDQSTQRLMQLQELALPQWFVEGRFLLFVWAPIFAIALSAAFLFFGWERLGMLGIAAAVALVLSIVATIFLRRIATRQVVEAYDALRSCVAEGRHAGTQLVADTRAACDSELKRLTQRRDHDVQIVRDKYQKRTAALVVERDREIAQSSRDSQRVIREATERRNHIVREADEKYPPLLEQVQSTYRTDLADAQHKFDRDKVENDERYRREWDELKTRWHEGIRRLVAAVAELNEHSERLFPPWASSAWDQWQPATLAPPSIRFGQLQIEMHQVPGGLSDEPELNDDVPEQFTLPALVDFPRAGSLLVQAAGGGRDDAIETVQAVMLRMLTTIPPGKVRFTIVDPVGLGENFAGFMHLADYDEVLVTSRIWTEPAHIEQRLVDLTEQMENIIQKYLRNEFKTIDEYNAQAGEVAEAFRILVVANFPNGFNEQSARRLTSIVTSGARCGVYTFMTVDANQQMPPGFDLNELAPHCTCLLWRDGEFAWRDSDFRPFLLTVDPAPNEARFTELVRMAGESAKDSRRVEVPFEYIAPRDGELWAANTLHGFDVPLGRAGATKLQRLRLGHGTSQHVLVAGKTGSGKSTLLHALVTNMSLLYSPDEVELYLIDFKKGVEFKTYATNELPHARVVAIESEREFGLSVLQRLDAELRERGDKFRAAGVQDLASFRQLDGQQPTPRILLVIDEFQELFVEDDKIAQDSSLLLDRLVRQGRAFGIHILLGSQTLGGAYSLARSTMGQMGVRIALQCSEADAHLILSEDNTAARLLSRPGEAIYNDAGGMLEGNNPFQVVWLADERRDDYLAKVRELARSRPPRRRTRQIVFEGNIPASLERNEALRSRLAASGDAATAKGACIGWLGDAVAIKDPTAVSFRRENGTNLLLVGQRDEAAASMFASLIVSIAAQRPPAESISEGRGARFYIFEASQGEAGDGQRIANLADVVPNPIRATSRREVPEILAELAAEVERRHAADGGAFPDLFLFVYDLGRFRDLRRDENEMGFSFSAEEKKPTPDKQFATILRDGPSVGVFTILWCDTLNNLNRSIDRQLLREFDLRILFQMSQNDSSYLADTPLASKLGPQLALFQNEESGIVEKFRPYAWPTGEFLSFVRNQLSGGRTSGVQLGANGDAAADKLAARE